MAYSEHDIENKALEFLSQPLGEGDAVLLHNAVLIAENELESRLRSGVSVSDIGNTFVCASAMLALSLFLELKAAQGNNVESFTAGKLRVELKDGGYSPAWLRESAERIILPYTDCGGFAFTGAEG